MIELSDLRGNTFVVNADLIEKVENNPDTQVVLTNGHRYYVTDSIAEIADLVVRYRGACRGAAEVWLREQNGE